MFCHISNVNFYGEKHRNCTRQQKNSALRVMRSSSESGAGGLFSGVSSRILATTPGGGVSGVAPGVPLVATGSA